jgi:hypothetical protein
LVPELPWVLKFLLTSTKFTPSAHDEEIAPSPQQKYYLYFNYKELMNFRFTTGTNIFKIPCYPLSLDGVTGISCGLV